MTSLHLNTLHLYANMDESPIQFHMPSKLTLNKTEEITVKSHSTGNENNFAMVMTCLADGSRLKSLIILKCKTMPKTTNKHGGVVATEEKGWTNRDITKLWIEKVW